MARARKTITPDPYAKPLAKPLPPSKSLPGKLKQFQAPTRADFDLVSPYGAAGDQPKAIEELTEGFKNGEQFQTLLGVTGSGKTFTMANVIKNVGKPTLILTHNKTIRVIVLLLKVLLLTHLLLLRWLILRLPVQII